MASTDLLSAPFAATHLLPVRPALTLAAYVASLTADTGKAHGVSVGRTWIRIVRADSASSRTAVAFVHAATGAVHRADSWRTPGRHLGWTLEVAS